MLSSRSSMLLLSSRSVAYSSAVSRWNRPQRELSKCSRFRSSKAGCAAVPPPHEHAATFGAIYLALFLPVIMLSCSLADPRGLLFISHICFRPLTRVPFGPPPSRMRSSSFPSSSRSSNAASA